MCVGQPKSDLHEGETGRVSEAEHTLHTTEWHLDRNELWIMHHHFWPDIDEALKCFVARVPAELESVPYAAQLFN